MAIEKIPGHMLSSGQFGGDYIKISDVKPNGTPGGILTAGIWQTRDLNTIDNNTAGLVTLNTNQFTLQPGTYRIEVKSQGWQAGRQKLRLRNVTDNADEALGLNHYQSSSDLTAMLLSLNVEFSITTAKTFELQHKGEFTTSNQGLGIELSYGLPEVYTIIELWRVKF